MNFLVYGLLDPRTLELRYVGKTNRTLSYRLKKHLDIPSKGNLTYKQAWIKQLKQLSLKPEIFLIESYSNEQEQIEGEKFWISYFKFLECKLTNLTLGGDGVCGFKMSEKTKEKMRQLKLGKPLSKEHKEKIGHSLRGQKRSDKAKQNMSKASKGKLKSPEHIAKMKAYRSTEEYKKTQQAKQKHAVKIKDQYGNIYNTICEASRITNAHRSKILLVLKGKRNHTKGYTFSYVNKES